jgi:DNA-binding NarL/FixJ family response regulator
MAHEKLTETEKKEINALLVDDHHMVREGLKKMLLALKPMLQIKVTEADSGIAALKKIEKRDFDIVFMDYQMPGMSGLETIYRMLRFKAHLKIITLSNYDDLSFVESVRDAGSKGYLLKNVDSSELMKAISSVLSGNFCYSNEISLKLLEAAENRPLEKKRNKNNLTPREMQILQLVALQLTDNEIGERLSISPRTVGTHRRNIRLKLGIKKSIGLFKEAQRMGLLD